MGRIPSDMAFSDGLQNYLWVAKILNGHIFVLSFLDAVFHLLGITQQLNAITRE